MAADPLVGLLAIPEAINQERRATVTQRAMLRFAGLPEEQINQMAPGATEPLGGTGIFGKILSGVGKTGAVLSAVMGQPLKPPRPTADLGGISNLLNIQEQAVRRRGLARAGVALEAGNVKGAVVEALKGGSTALVNLYGGGAGSAKTPAAAEFQALKEEYEKNGMSAGEAGLQAAADIRNRNAKDAAAKENRLFERQAALQSRTFTQQEEMLDKRFAADAEKRRQERAEERADSQAMLRDLGFNVGDQASEPVVGPPAPGAPGAPAKPVLKRVSINAKGQPSVVLEVPKPTLAQQQGEKAGPALNVLTSARAAVERSWPENETAAQAWTRGLGQTAPVIGTLQGTPPPGQEQAHRDFLAVQSVESTIPQIVASLGGEKRISDLDAQQLLKALPSVSVSKFTNITRIDQLIARIKQIPLYNPGEADKPGAVPIGTLADALDQQMGGMEGAAGGYDPESVLQEFGY